MLELVIIVNVTRRQHTVPRTYLKNFSEKRRKEYYLYTFEKRSGRIHENNIKNAAVEKDWYTLDALENKLAWENFYATEIETRYIHVEKLMRTACSALVTNQSNVIDDITKAETSIIMIYQLFRGRVARKYADLFAARVLPQIIGAAKEDIGKSLNEDEFAGVVEKVSSENFKKQIYAEVLTDPKRLLPYAREIANRCWVLFRIMGDEEFITSDNPVAVGSINKSDSSLSHLAFLNSKNAIHYPISPKLMIAAYDKNLFLGALQEYDGSLVLLNNKTERSYIDAVNKHMAEQSYSQVFAKSRRELKRACK